MKKNRRHSFTKKAAQKAHAARRAKERFGIDLGREAQRSIVGRIRAGKAKLLGWQSLRVKGYEIEHEGKLLTVLYDRKRKVLITVLPPGAKWRYAEGFNAEGAQPTISAPHLEEGRSLSLSRLHEGTDSEEREGATLPRLRSERSTEEDACSSNEEECACI